VHRHWRTQILHVLSHHFLQLIETIRNQLTQLKSFLGDEGFKSDGACPLEDASSNLLGIAIPKYCDMLEKPTELVIIVSLALSKCKT
jgi:hypothetical protein